MESEDETSGWKNTNNNNNNKFGGGFWCGCCLQRSLLSALCCTNSWWVDLLHFTPFQRWMDTFLSASTSPTRWNHAISAIWLGNPNRARSRSPHSFQSAYEYPVDYQSEEFCAHWSGHIGLPNHTAFWGLERLAYFEHVVQSLSNTRCLFGANS